MGSNMLLNMFLQVYIFDRIKHNKVDLVFMRNGRETWKGVKMSLIRGIHHVCLKCANEEEYKEVVHFYHEILELEIARTWSEGTMFRFGNAVLEVFANGGGKAETGIIRHFALATEDVDACVEKLKAAGYKVFVEPKDIVIPSNPEYKARIAFGRGPLGEEIEFFQER